MRQVAVDQAEHGDDAEVLQHLAPIDHVFALGDCCARMDLALPALAQVCRRHQCYFCTVPLDVMLSVTCRLHANRLAWLQINGFVSEGQCTN